MRGRPRRGALTLRRTRTRAWERLRPDPWGESCGAGAGGGCDPAHAFRLPGLGGRDRLGSGRPRCRLLAASGLSRAPAPSGIRCAAHGRVTAVREPGGDVAVGSSSLPLGEGREGIHTPPPPANEKEGAAAHLPKRSAHRREEPTRPAHIKLPAGHAQNVGCICTEPRGTDSVAGALCDRHEGQAAQPADLSREQHVGGAGWPEPRSNTQPERRAWPCVALSAQGGAVSEPCVQRSGGRWAADDPRQAAGGSGVWTHQSTLREHGSSRFC